jgi:hypothetical protein
MPVEETLQRETPKAKKPAAKRAATSSLIEDHNAHMNVGKENGNGKVSEADIDADAMDKLEPGAGDSTSWLDKPVDDLSEIKRWVIGKPPEKGGEDTEYAIYIQQPLGWMARSRFFSLMSSALSRAIRATGGEVAGMGDIFGDSGGTLRERGEKLMARDWQDASSFAAMGFELLAYVPNLLLECYCLWLAIPIRDQGWAKKVFEQPWDPERNKWGLTDAQHRELLGRFIDQNYEELRSFFTEDLPAVGRRVVANERARAARESESVPSKQSSTSGQPEEETS